MRKALAATVAILLFSLAAAAPQAAAATAVQGAPCQLSSMNAQEQNDWFKSIFGYMAEELNGLKDSALKANTPGQVQQVNVYPTGMESYSIRDIAGLVNMAPAQLAAEFGIYADRPLSKSDAERLGKPEGTKLTADEVADYKLSRAQALTISTRHPDKAGALNRLLGISAGVQTEPFPYQNMKIRLPGEQKDVPLSQILDRAEINSSDCFVSSSDIKGRLEFVALLDRDLRLGASGESSRDAPGQHISYSRVTSSIAPYDGSIVVPRQFERYVIAIGNVATLDMALTLFESFYTAYSTIGMKAKIADADKRLKEVSSLATTGNVVITPQSAEAFARQTGGLTPTELLNMGVSSGSIDDAIRVQATRLGVQPGQIQAIDAKAFQDMYFDGAIDTDTFKKAATNFHPLQGVNPSEIDNAMKASEGIVLNAEIKDLNGQLRSFTDLAAKLQQRTITTFGFGLAWLGPARFALDLSNSLLLESSTAGRNQYFDLYINNKDYLSSFRKATDFMGLGGMSDFASDFFGQGVPTKAYETGPVYLINSPILDRDKPSTSTTSLRNEGSRWNINFNWAEGGENRAESLFFEDISGSKDYTSLAFSSKNQVIHTSFDRKKLNSDLQRAVEIAVPVFNFLTYRLEAMPGTAAGLAQLMVYNFIVTRFVDPANFDPEQKCDSGTVTKFITMYTGLVATSQVLTLIPVIGGPKATVTLATNYGGKAVEIMRNNFPRLISAQTAAGLVGSQGGLASLFSTISKANSLINFVDPLQLAKQLYASRGQRYVSYCKDDEYKVVAWQKLSTDSKAGGASVTQTLQKTGIEQLTGGLNIGAALGGVGEKVKQAQMADVLSFRSVYYDGMGSLNSPKLVYLHLDGGTMQWHSVYAQAGACFKSNLQSKDGSAVFTVDSNGVKKTVNGTTVASFSGADWKDRGLFSQRLPGYAMTLVPNKIITTQLDCGSSNVLQADSKGALTASSECAATACLAAGVLQSSGETDFSRAVGTVSRIEAEKGTFTIANGYIYYSPSSGEGANKQIRIPAVEAEDAGKREGGTISVTGDGQVKAAGYTSKDLGEIDAGALRTIIADKARIEYEPSTRLLRAAVYSMAGILSNSVLGFNTRPASNVDANGKSIPAIRIDGVGAKAGNEEAAAAFNKALNQIQGATGGLQMLETADHTYFFTTDAQGNPVLRIFDKKTGQTREIPITGAITRDANGNIVVPTKDGNFQFKMDMQDGKPIINVNGPGISELATLLAARGQNGLLAYNPATGLWEVFNGQDIPWNRDFAKNGLSVFGSPDGSKGVSQASIFAPPARAGTGYESNPLAAMPSWPEGLAFVAMVGAIAGGAALIRLRR